MIISDHAREAMERKGVTEHDIQTCLEHGELEFRQLVTGERRYGKKLQLKDKDIIVVYTLRDDVRVITVYTITRKQWR